ncbi:cellobiohydrolase [Ascobolus immersus RN42]|uniref:Glucanase n=1 Tax=Ascobolus immersus RN42 TaxID=1160509 RepID=A0A3N4IH86_ASCIM|nr:cellobiohydrolase [Ascobolus immersus RN42]
MLFSKATFAALVACAAVASAHPGKPGNKDVNPFLGKELFINSGYAAKLQATIDSFLAEGDKKNAARTRTVQKKISTYVWISKNSDIELFEKFLDEALEDLKKQKGKNKKDILFPLVIYNLPERDCSAAASDGELKLADDGWNKYKAYIDRIAKILKTKGNKKGLEFSIVIEPDSLGNLVTNLSVEKCQGAKEVYQDGIAYALKNLQQKNLHLYIDAAHSNWLGWPANLEPSAKLFKEVVRRAGKNVKIRGFATNVSNYNAYKATVPDIIYGGNATHPDNANWSEHRYVTALTPYLLKEGLPAKFIIDQGRSGAQNIRLKGGHWCNIADSGFGIRPTTNTGDKNVDALVWVKPGGESDGTSDESSRRFDENCRSPDAHVPAPEAGDWFNEFVKDLVKNANPPLEETYEKRK